MLPEPSAAVHENVRSPFASGGLMPRICLASFSPITSVFWSRQNTVVGSKLIRHGCLIPTLNSTGRWMINMVCHSNVCTSIPSALSAASASSVTGAVQQTDQKQPTHPPIRSVGGRVRRVNGCGPLGSYCWGILAVNRSGGTSTSLISGFIFFFFTAEGFLAGFVLRTAVSGSTSAGARSGAGASEDGETCDSSVSPATPALITDGSDESCFSASAVVGVAASLRVISDVAALGSEPAAWG